jgi:hypothetical protein
MATVVKVILQKNLKRMVTWNLSDFMCLSVFALVLQNQGEINYYV